jgi:hypothetical protein
MSNIENIISENDPTKQNKEESSETAPKLSLADAMIKITGEAGTQALENQQPKLENISGMPANMPLEEVEKTEWFKSLPQEAKDLVRSGVHIDPVMNDLSNVVTSDQRELLDQVNSERELKGQDKITSFTELKTSKVENKKEASSDEDEEKNILRFIREEEGVSTEDQMTEAEAVKKTSLTFEKMLEDADIAEFVASPTIEWGGTSAALSVKVIRNKDYEDNVKSVLEANDIKFKVNNKDKLKKALLNSFIQRNNHVTTPLINSGFHVTLSGASIPEIINMNSIEAQSRAQMDIKKLSFVKKHLVDSSIGKIMNLQQFMKLISYKDMQTLYFNLFIGTFPELNEFPTTCANEKCQIPLKLNLHTADLVLNAADFLAETNYILYQNTEIKNVLDQSVVSKETQVKLNNGILIRLRHPSMYDMVNVYARVEEETSKKRLAIDPTIAGYLLYITVVALPDDGEYVRYDTIDELLEILSVVDESTLYAMEEQIEQFVKPLHSVKYGVKSYICPVCKHVHPEQAQPMDEFLFTFASIKMEVKKAQEFRKREEKNKLLGMPQ